MNDRPRRVFSSFSEYGGREEPTGYGVHYEQRRYRPPQPRATYALLGTIVGVFILELIVDATYGQATLLKAFAIHIDVVERPWTLISSTLAHGGFTHLFFNGLFLFFFGPTIEFVLGWKRYVVLFLVAGALSGVAQVGIEYYGDLYYPDLFEPRYAWGASGALMALLGMSLILIPKSKLIIFPLPVPIPLWVGGIFFALMDVLGAFNPESGVGNFAHLSGLALGLVYGIQVKRDIARRGLRLAYG